ncbi:hypothetical protein XENTR_v10017220 [Xenopus tropicalis]|nr:hypothetical protein XENTR_v10017220 [Xenopus tropicalis]
MRGYRECILKEIFLPLCVNGKKKSFGFLQLLYIIGSHGDAVDAGSLKPPRGFGCRAPTLALLPKGLIFLPTKVCKFQEESLMPPRRSYLARTNYCHGNQFAQEEFYMKPAAKVLLSIIIAVNYSNRFSRLFSLDTDVRFNSAPPPRAELKENGRNAPS